MTIKHKEHRDTYSPLLVIKRYKTEKKWGDKENKSDKIPEEKEHN